MITEILTVTLVVSNLIWMTFFIITHAQHMRAYQWMVGFRPLTPSSVERVVLRDVQGVSPMEPSPLSVYPDKQLVPTAGIGEIVK